MCCSCQRQAEQEAVPGTTRGLSVDSVSWVVLAAQQWQF